MATEELGEASQPISQNRDEYADYYEINAEPSETAGTVTPEPAKVEEKPADNKPEAKPQASDLSPEKPQPQHVPNWKKKIDKQTKQIAELRAELEKTKGSDGQKQTKYTRENFVNDEEFEAWREKSVTQRIRDELKQEMLEKELQRAEQEKNEVEHEAFRESWQQKVKSNYDVNSTEFAEYTQIARNQDYLASLPEAVHDFVESTEYGPLMIHVLYYRPDLVTALANSKPIAQTRTLMRLESEIEAAYKGKASESKQVSAPAPKKEIPAISKAPAPIGSIKVEGDTAETDDASEYARYVKKHILRR